MVLVEGSIRKSFKRSSTTADSSFVKFALLNPLRKQQQKKVFHKPLITQQQQQQIFGQCYQPSKDITNTIDAATNSSTIASISNLKSIQQQLTSSLPLPLLPPPLSQRQQQRQQQQEEEQKYQQLNTKGFGQQLLFEPVDYDLQDQSLLEAEFDCFGETLLPKSGILISHNNSLKNNSKIPRPPPPPRTVSTCVLTQRPSGSSADPTTTIHRQAPFGPEYSGTEVLNKNQIKILQGGPLIAQPVKIFN